jgi:hypothetical protein
MYGLGGAEIVEGLALEAGTESSEPPARKRKPVFDLDTTGEASNTSSNRIGPLVGGFELTLEGVEPIAAGELPRSEAVPRPPNAWRGPPPRPRAKEAVPDSGGAPYP